MTAVSRRALRNFDWLIFGLVLFMSISGIMTIYSATRVTGTGEMPDFYLKQISWLVIAIITLLVCTSFDYSWLSRLSLPLYITGIISLVIVLVMGRSGMGAKRWLQLGPLNFQPSEFFRLVFIIAFAFHLSRLQGRLHLGNIIKAAILFLIIPVALIIKEPDLGSALILIFVFFITLLIRGVRKKAVIILIVIGVISVPFLERIVWSQLKDYQKNRLVAFVKPQIDPSGIGYQIEQSKITIGSGRFSGKGYLKGTQGPFRFLPEKHTDFIFSIFAEEWGFLGCFLLLAAYLVLLLRGIDTALKAKDMFGKILSFSIVIMFFTYFVINVGMALGMMPVVGVPLPFMSYGGTALISNFAAAGILINVRMRRFKLFY
ncbi:MAG TPA: rod shape-determining protein RodA [Nitrospirae bacterium]|nr:rod shape-determining protein RodA [Nitrospirota bacterium]